MGEWRRRKPASVPNQREGSVSKMSFFTENDRRSGRICWVVSKYWPDKTRFRRRVENKTIAKDLHHQIEAAVANGSWPELRRRLTEPPPKVDTIEEFSKVYFNEYCTVQNTRPDFKEHALKPIVRLLGHLRLDEVSRKHGHQYKKERRPEVGSNATVNREFSVLHNMLTFAVDKRIISLNPLDRFKKLPEPQTVLQVMTLDEERRLIDAV